ncbi:MAG: hypothetical protein IJR49_04540 [Treponema sp.]|nr:hypothetical protein [Treponema sp.]
MTLSRKHVLCSKYKPSSALKKNGISWIRFVFSGLETDTGSERLFFIELELLNPYLSPDKVVLGFKNRVNISEDDLQYALAGTTAAHNLHAEAIRTPSYVVVRAGCLGSGAKQLCSYHPIKDSGNSFKLLPFNVGTFTFSDEAIVGEISYTESEINAHPEYLCDSGAMSWDLRYAIQHSFSAGFDKSGEAWIPCGARVNFTGSVTVDGSEYRVVPKSSYGYIDINFAKTLPIPYFHISTSNLTSLITGKTLFNSCFTVQGLYNDAVSTSIRLEDSEICINAQNTRVLKSVWKCSQSPQSEDEEKLHWSLSLDTKKWVVDIDVFCNTSQLFVRNIELPEGNRRVMKILSGGTGTGEIRVYRHVGKNLEIIENMHIAGALCEFGQVEEGSL